MSSLMTGMALLLAASVLQRLVGFVRATLFCRWLDASQLGLWDMAFGFLMTATPLVILALPGCLGRYVEYYRQRGMLRLFLKRTAIVSGFLAISGAAAVTVGAGPLAELVFGNASYRPLVYYLAFALVAVAAFNYLYELAMALRLNRWISLIQLLNSILFAGLGLGLLVLWRNDAQTVIIAYGLACAITASIAFFGLKPWRLAANEEYPLSIGESFWPKILQYSLWVWAAGAISNLFAVVDRYMVLHWLPPTHGDPLALLGDYHASRLVPMLFVSLAGLLAAMSTPHLSHLWETGQSGHAAKQLNLLTKLLSLGLLVGSSAVLLAGPLLFNTLLAGKYPAGLDILPVTLAYCSCFSLFLLLQNYVLCCEKAYFAGLALACGLLVNIGLNLAWLPVWGLTGAVCATLAANGVALLVLLVINHRLGQPIDVGLVLALIAPLGIALGTDCTLAITAAALFFSRRTVLFINAEEKRELGALVRQLLSRKGHPGDLASSPTSFSSITSSATPQLTTPCKLDPSLKSSLITAENVPVLPRELPAKESDQVLPPGRACFNPFFRLREHPPLGHRGPLRVMFVITCMPVGGAERLLVDLVRRLDRRLFAPELCCLKYLGPLGEVLAQEIPAFTGLLKHKYDFRVLPRLYRLLRDRRVDAVVTVGTGGDKMFWGRLAAYLAGVPVIASALHSTGLPDRVELLNRLLTPLTDAFIAVSPPHAQYIIKHEGCPANRTWIVPNGIDTDRFSPRPADPRLRAALGVQPQHRVVAVVAALRPEKNHELLLQAAPIILAELPQTRFLIVGDGPRREELQQLARRSGVDQAVIFTGNRNDVPDVLACADVAVLCSHMEANPLAVLEALACEKPVVATAVGSVPLHVLEGETGFLVPPGDAQALAAKCLILLRDPDLARRMGRAGRRHVLKYGALERTVAGYQRLIATIYARKCGGLSSEAHHSSPTSPSAYPSPIPCLSVGDAISPPAETASSG
ncbi:glycosyltransferase [Thermogutta sp.]|uniref:glycosyltransferase n=1 Tax=Thermogutta sp. TaxID=1962930 RepID=UPI0032204222